MKKKSLAIIGCGRLAQIVVDALRKNMLDEYELVAVYSRSKAKAQAISEQLPCRVCNNVDELLECRPDYIVETASPEALREFAVPALQAGSSVVTLSIGALADDAFYDKVKAAANRGGSRVYIASGAIGGLDVLRTATLMGNATAKFDTEKGPHSLRNTPVYEEVLQTQKKTVFEGNAIDAIRLFPTKVNVSVAASIASVGSENMRVSITSTPDFVGDDHRIEIKNDQVHAVIDVYSSTAQIAGWSIVSTLQNIVSPIVF